MKKVSFLLAIAIAAGLTSCTAQSPKANLKTEVDSMSYAVGMANTQGLKDYLVHRVGIDTTYMAEFINGLNQGVKGGSAKKELAFAEGLKIGQQISEQILPAINKDVFANDSTKVIDVKNFMAGFIAGTTGKGGIMTPEDAMTYFQEKAAFLKYGDTKAEGVKFLEENKGKEGVVTTESGLQYKVITTGKGAIPTDKDRVKVHYKGTLINGTEFDSSYKRNEPATFGTTQVIKGWTEALLMMPVGSKWELYIPQELAYGDRDTGTIPPFSTLVFEVELIGIEK